MSLVREFSSLILSQFRRWRQRILGDNMNMLGAIDVKWLKISRKGVCINSCLHPLSQRRPCFFASQTLRFRFAKVAYGQFVQQTARLEFRAAEHSSPYGTLAP